MSFNRNARRSSVSHVGVSTERLDAFSNNCRIRCVPRKNSHIIGIREALALSYSSRPSCPGYHAPHAFHGVFVTAFLKTEAFITYLSNQGALKLATYLATKPHLESPSITWAIRWLQKNIPDDQRTLVLVHGDFNLHNILGDGNQVTGVVDWETSMFGSAEHDLAYIKPHVSQHMEWETFLDFYVSQGGTSVKTEDMPFYTAFAWTQLMIGASQLHSSIFAGRNRDIRFIMCEQAFTSIFMGAAL
ncbi:hypothetical protein NM208_g2044 [Fusarium decemcellulare]|uniref:Uncharacterized protein n=1 Tax=Fusarium decemcellulare TaxID=57161 RepID=A0ACC1STS7_9HYPO|nr:hypothetical protein NM208_g2044 [Fusarium decemcellulare]